MKSQSKFRSFCVLTSSCIFAFMSSGSFKACGVLFDDAVVLYKTSNLFAGWAFCFQLSVALIVGGISDVLVKDVSYRTTGMLGGFLFGLGFTCLGIFGQTVWQLFLFTGTTAFGGGLLYYVCYLSLIEHFKSKFGLYFSIRELFSFVGITVMPPLLEVLRSHYGFHGGYMLLGAVTWNIVLCGVLLQPVIPSPEGMRKDTAYDEKERRNGTKDYLEDNKEEHEIIAPSIGFSSFVKHPQFFLYFLIHSLFFFEFAVWAVFLVPFGKSLGLKSDVAVLLSTAGGIGGLFGKITSLVAFYFDRMNALTSSMFPAVLCTISLIGYISTTKYTCLMLFSASFGFALAFAEAALSGVLPKLLCRQHLRQGVTMTYLVNGIFVQLAGIVTGAILDLTSSFSVVFETLIVCNIVICTLGMIWFVIEKPVAECDS